MPILGRRAILGRREHLRGRHETAISGTVHCSRHEAGITGTVRCQIRRTQGSVSKGGATASSLRGCGAVGVEARRWVQLKHASTPVTLVHLPDPYAYLPDPYAPHRLTPTHPTG